MFVSFRHLRINYICLWVFYSAAARVALPSAPVPPVTSSSSMHVAPSAGDDLRAYFHGAASAMDLAALHPLLAQLLRQLLVAPLPPGLKHLLPDVGGELWSAVEERRQAGIPVSLRALQRYANTALHEATAGDSSRIAAKPHPWYDAEGFVTSYRAIINSPECPVPYSATILMSNIHHPFPLPEWWGFHAPGCGVCSQHQVSCGGPIEALLANHRNPCWFADVIAWLSGQWRIPLSALPEPAERPDHVSLLWSPLALRPEVERMIQWGVLTRQLPPSSSTSACR